MRKKSFSLGLAVVIITSNLIFGSNVFAAESSSKSIPKVNLPKLDTIQRIVPGQRIKTNLNEDHFYKIDIKGHTYIIEGTLVDVKKPSSSGLLASASNKDTTTTCAYDLQVYSDKGFLQGTFVTSQTWTYNSGTFIDEPNPKAKGTVPWYSWPNSWSNKHISPPTYNSSTQKYTSSTQEDLTTYVPTPAGAIPLNTFTCYVDYTFDAFGHGSASGHLDYD